MYFVSQNNGVKINNRLIFIKYERFHFLGNHSVHNYLVQVAPFRVSYCGLQCVCVCVHIALTYIPIPISVGAHGLIRRLLLDL